jgi:hypothetical protein
MSRYITNQSLKEEEARVRQYFADRQKVIDDIKVPDMMKVRKADGYYKGDDVAGTVSMDKIKSFWKIPDKAGAALDDIISGAKITAAAYSGGLAGAAAAGASELSKKDFEVSGWVNFDDSDAALDKGDDSNLYYYLTKDEQELAESDDTWQTVSTVGSVIAGIASGGTTLIAGTANPNIRESLQEALGLRHPDLLKNAIKRRNADLRLQQTIKNEKALNKKVLEETKAAYDMADLQSTLYVQKIAPIMNDISRRSLGQSATIPVNISIPSSASIPVDFAKGRGLSKKNPMHSHLNHFLAPHKIQWERRAMGGHTKFHKRPEEVFVRY